MFSSGIALRNVTLFMTADPSLLLLGLESQ